MGTTQSWVSFAIPTHQSKLILMCPVVPGSTQEPEVVGAHHGMVDDDVASLLRERGKQLFTWTINDVGMT
jgi:hypothetical protein